MSIYDNKVMKYWDFVFTDLADPRTNHWPLVSSPVPLLTILIMYHYFVKSWGPRYMANRKPFKLERTLIVYNFIQVIASIYILYEGLDGAWMRHYSWRCQPVDWTESPEAMRIARGCFVYYMAKISELLDTVFFVVRKKERQITFLHLYHHTVMPMISWGATKYYPGGHGTFIGVINSFVHIIMYSYYLMSAMGPQYQKYLWWKKHITTMQMVQFCMAFLHSAQLLYTDCGYPRWSVCFTLPNAIFFYILFNDFYQNSYKKRKEAATAAALLADSLPNERKLLEHAKQKNGYKTACTNGHANGHANGTNSIKEMNGNSIDATNNNQIGNDDNNVLRSRNV